MQTDQTQSRRVLLKRAAALAAAGPVLGQAPQKILKMPDGSLAAYVGTYSSPQGPEGSKGNGKGIYLFHMNPSTGALTQRALFANDANPSWLAFDTSRTHLYAANEANAYHGANAGSVSAYAIDRANGHLTLLNTVSSEAAGPTHLSVHPSGKYVLVANYAGGTFTVLSIQPNGGLGAATDMKHDAGSLGEAHAASAPPGSFAISGHDRTHAHMVDSDHSGQFVFGADLGMDQILIWKFDAQNGKLLPNNPPFVQFPSGDGPRHFRFHPNGRWFYSLQEEASTLATFDYDAAAGKLAAKQTISSLPKGFRGTNFTSEVMVSSDGRFVYAANRLHDSIAYFAVGQDGTLTFAGEEWTRGDYPRSFNFDPTGNFLYTCNQRADAIATFRVNKKTGALTFTGQYTDVGTPSYILFLT